MSEIILSFIKAFIVGGTICLIAQIIINVTKLTAGRILVVFLLVGVILQAFGIYEYLVDFAGAGATIPISGFGFLLAKGAIEGAKTGILGAITGGLNSACAGVSAAIIFGFLFSLIFKPKSKYN
jgi:stage V sporulation protein AE